MNIILEDFASWKVENDNIVSKLKNTIIIDRVEDVLKVTDFLYNKALSESLDEDEENILNTGFQYLNEQILLIKECFKNYCDNDVEILLKVEVMINLIMYIEDITTELVNHTKDTSYENLFGDLLNDIDVKLKAEEVDITILDRFNERIEKYSNQLKFEYVGVPQIFSEIADYYKL